MNTLMNILQHPSHSPRRQSVGVVRETEPAGSHPGTSPIAEPARSTGRPNRFYYYLVSYLTVWFFEPPCRIPCRETRDARAPPGAALPLPVISTTDRGPSKPVILPVI